MKILTIGFTKKTAKQFFDLLEENGVERLVDIRLHPDGQLAGFTKKEDLRYFLKELIGNRLSSMVRECLQERMVFLRIGLARPTWEIHPHCCFLQINAVYSFPDYLDGRCFVDFLSG